MNHLVILGAGTAGTMAANKLRNRLRRDEWQIVVVDQDDEHLYQPGLLLVPFDDVDPEALVKPRHRFMSPGCELLQGTIDRVDPDERLVHLEDGTQLPYDYLIIATGTSPRPDQTPGMLGPEWQRSIFDFYTLDGALALREKLRFWEGGRLVVHITEMPIKCPVAPLEFAFLAHDFFTEHGMREQVEFTYLTPLEGAFTKPIASRRLGGMLSDRGISVEGDFVVDHIDPERRLLVSVDEREVPFDLLVTVPLNMGADFLDRSRLGNELNYVPVDRQTMLSKAYDTIFAIGDANDIPTSKAGSVAHFEVDLFVDNFIDHTRGRPMRRLFDGHANCFVDSGKGKGLLIDFNYDVEPLPGKYPIPGIGPFRLLEETHVNHLGKLGFRWAYWHLLLRGRPMPVPALMSMAGKRPEA